MNLGQFDKAEQLLEKLDAEKGDKEFLLAEASLGKEELDKALDYLTEAIKFNPHNKGYALNSPAFAEYLNHEKFQFLCQKKNEENE
jgi:tetratricopeptide (TPR) repeat protein